MQRNIWNQLKNKTSQDLIKALKKDGWILDDTIGAVNSYRKVETNGTTSKRITIHVHSKNTYKPDLLKHLLDQTGWNKEDFIRLKLIKKK